MGSPAGTAQQKPQELRTAGGEFVCLPTGPELRVYLCTSSEERAYGANKQVRLCVHSGVEGQERGEFRGVPSGKQANQDQLPSSPKVRLQSP